MGFKTFKIDRLNQRITGLIDNAEAYWQRIQKALSTDKFYWLYYDQNYGLHNMQSLIGKPLPYVEIWAENYITECAMQVDGTEKVDNFTFEEVGVGKLHISCVIWSIYGSQEFTKDIEI